MPWLDFKLEVIENFVEFASAGFGIGRPFVLVIANVATSFEVYNRAFIPAA